MTTSTRILAVGALLGVAVLGACTDDTDPVAPEATVDAALLAIFAEAIQDEYHAEAVYAGVIEDFGPVLPFSNIVRAEAKHALNIRALYEARGLEAPTSTWHTGNVPHFGSVQEACTAGAVAEVANLQMYDGFLAMPDIPADVALALERNKNASINAHLPAFERCTP